MSKILTFKLPIVRSEHLSGTTVLSVSTEMNSVFVGQSARAIAKLFERAAMSDMVSKGYYDKLLKYLPEAEPCVRSIEVNIAKGEKRFEDESYKVTFPIVVWQYAVGDILGFVPGLSLGCHVKKLEELDETLEKIILLEFRRNDRLDDNKSLIAAQWYREPSVIYEDIDLEFYTPSELKSLAENSEEKILAKTCERMNRLKKKYYNLDGYLEQISQNLQGEYRQSVLIVGPSGCGKSALVQAYVNRYGRHWRDRPWYTSAAQMLKTLTEDGGWQYGLGRWVKELRDCGEVVYIGNLAEWFEVGQYSGNSVSIAEALRDPLQRGEILLIAEVTQEQLEKIELRSAGYGQLFQTIEFKQRKQTEEDEIALNAIQNLAKLNEIAIESEAITRITYLQRRYAPYSGFPGKVIRFFESLLLQLPRETRSLKESDVITAFCEETGMPRFLVDTEVPFLPEEAKSFFSDRVIGQTQAIEELVLSLVSVKTRMTRGGKPINSLLFVGPTGVGKTQLAKTLARFIFGDEDKMIRFDMSEYSDPYAVMRLIHAHESSLVSRVRQTPFSVLLFDEIEKAAPNFFDLLLQVLGEGRLTDDKGGVANFCSTVIIMTSNIGAQDYMKPVMGFGAQSGNKQEISKHFENIVTQYFRPEFFNRIDHLVPFLPLTVSEQQAVIKKELNLLLETPGIKSRPIVLSMTDALWDWLINLNIDFRYGARALQRALKSNFIWPLAEELSAYGANERLHITLDVVDQKLHLTKKRQTDEPSSPIGMVDICDKVSELRRDLQALTAGSTWIGFLSEIDKIEIKKRKAKDKFWANADLVKEYTQLTKMNTRQQESEAYAYELENRCFTLAQQSMDVQEYGDRWQTISTDYEIFNPKVDSLFFEIESKLKNELNRCLIAIYGNEERISYLESLYSRALGELGFEFNKYFIYLKKSGFEYSRYLSEDKVAEAIENEEEIKQALMSGDNEKIEYPYWIHENKHDDEFTQVIGLLITVAAPCAQYFFTHELGVHEIKKSESEKFTCFVDLSDKDLENYIVPLDVHRRSFYEKKRPRRWYEDVYFRDKKLVNDEGTMRFVEHSDLSVEMQDAARSRVRENLLKRYEVKEHE